MLKREVTSHLLITLIWLGIVTFFRWNWQWNLILLWLGGFVGTFLLDIDHLLYTLWVYPHELTSMRVRRLIDQRQLKDALVLLVDTHEERFKFSFHNALFQPILYIACFFVLTSTGSLFGAGLIMAMALHLLKDEFSSLLRMGDEFTRKWLFWQIKREISFYYQKLFVILMLIIFLTLNILLI